MLPLIIGIQSTELSAEEIRKFERWQPAGYILFSRNIQTAQQTRALTDHLRAISRHTPLIGVDQEGGRVVRTQALGLSFPSASKLASAGGMLDIDRHATCIARALELLGINLDFAPVLDIAHAPEAANALSSRYFGSTAQEVITRAGKWIKGLTSCDILACGKHFPGLGHAQSDPHFDLPVIAMGVEELWQSDMQPFIHLSNKLPMIMLAHIMLPQVDANLPTSLSPQMVQLVLKRRMGYRGLICTDDLDMQAIAREHAPAEAVLLALQAGAQLPMVCHSLDRLDEIGRAVEEQLEPVILQSALREIGDVCWKLPAPPEFQPEYWNELMERARTLFPANRWGEGSVTGPQSPVNRY